MPKIVDKDQKRALILDAALPVFAQKGAQQAKIADIAKEAGIGKGTIYEYFSTKEEIFLACIHHNMEKAAEIYMRHFKGLSSPVEIFEASIAANVEVTKTHQDFVRVSMDFWALGLRGEQMKEWKEQFEMFHGLVLDVLRLGNHQGLFVVEDLDKTAKVYLALLDGVQLQYLMLGEDFDFEGTLRMALQVFFHGIMNHQPNPFGDGQ